MLRYRSLALAPIQIIGAVILLGIVAYLLVAIGAILLFPMMAVVAGLFRLIIGFPEPLQTFCVVLLMMVVGLGLYVLREEKRFWYGIVELAFALMATGAATRQLGSTQSPGDISTWYALGGAAYLTVRAIDNISKGIDEDKKTDQALGQPTPAAVSEEHTKSVTPSQ